jgi:hypothetical protein
VMISSGAWLGLVALPGIFLGLYLREREARRQVERGQVDIRSSSLRPNVS